MPMYISQKIHVDAMPYFIVSVTELLNAHVYECVCVCVACMSVCTMRVHVFTFTTQLIQISDTFAMTSIVSTSIASIQRRTV